MTEWNDKEQRPYSATFAPLVRQKFIGPWAMHQAVIGLACLSLFMLGMGVAGVPVVSWNTLVLFSLMVFDLWIYHGLSLWQVVALRLGLLLRRATGGSRSTVSPITAGDQVASLDIPGPQKRDIQEYSVMNSGRYDGACWLWSASRGEATASVRFRSDGSQLAKYDVKNMMGDEFSKMLHGLSEFPEVVRVTLQLRSLLKPTPTEDHDQVDNAASSDLSYVEDAILPYALNHDYVLSLTLDPSKAEGVGRRPKAGQVDALMVERITDVFDMLSTAGITRGSARWLNAAQLRGEMKTITDPEAGALLDSVGGLADDVPIQTSWSEHHDYMAVGPSFARTYWVDRWPDQHRVWSDWLARINATSDMQMIFTEVFSPRSEKEAKDSLDSKSAGSGLANYFNRRLARPDDKKAELEAQNLERRRLENSKEGGDILFQGFFTVISQDLPGLDSSCRQLQSRVKKVADLHLDHQADQQLARWIGALPLGLEGRI